MSVGGVKPRKNMLVQDASGRTRRVVPDLHWAIAGSASIFEHTAYCSAFEQRFGALEPATRAAIVRTAVLDETAMARLLVSADVLVHASTQEGFGLCVLEATAANTPVMVSRGVPFDEYLNDARSVRVDPIAPDDVAAWDRARLAITADAARRRPHARQPLLVGSLRRAARARISQRAWNADMTRAPYASRVPKQTPHPKRIRASIRLAKFAHWASGSRIFCVGGFCRPPAHLRQRLTLRVGVCRLWSSPLCRSYRFAI